MNQSLVFSGWRYRVLIGSVVCSALLYLALSLWGGWPAVSAAVRRVGWWEGGKVAGLVLLGYGLRFLRWQVYLNALRHPMPWWPSLKIYLAGFALTTTPGKAGEALRGVLLKRRDVPYVHSFAALFSERLSDLLAMVALALFGLSTHPEWLSMIVACLVLLACCMLLVSRASLVTKINSCLEHRHGLFSRLLRHAVQVLHQSRRCHTPSRQIGATLLSVLAWGLEGLAFYWILIAMNADVSLTSAIFIYAVSMLAGALSFMPGGLGSAEAVMVALLVSGGAGLPDAIAATVLLRFVTLWLAVGLGAVMFMQIER
ncbi:lysylphosphatidylglycerol synthase transmembrane domain-containing protein [Pseudomonas sp. BW7P1]|uniref:lysylphosphatidylglycerol synthase transmembrane domain-containing protein n=1 Tax=Pseudomonas TaxID=286 RepID=UPI0021AE2856|nr:lysylphosphatidylglycerol synthase transmembrane domain-containing protein [Pseudomonas sp. BW7P1]UWI60886.1 flippase-like domain-containing protein [Pseudomonas sp. BW7P1]